MRVEDDPLGYDGFCIDLLKEMAKTLNFTFEIIEVEDGTYGAQVSRMPTCVALCV